MDDRCIFVNPAFEQLTGLAAVDALNEGWCRAIHPDDLELARTHYLAAKHGRSEAVKMRLVTPGGIVRWASARWAALHDVNGEPTGFLGTFEDVTERHVLEQRLEYDATHDRLTGLGSRALLNEELGAGLARARRNRHSVALLFIDLDGFKRVNDMLGHAAGDELLVQVARRLRDRVREGDVCVRMGGDEFVVCCPDLESITQPVALADRLLARIAEPYDVHGHEVTVGASIGMATAQGEDPMSVDQLLSNADLAAYRAKRLGRGRVEMFDDDLRRRLAQGRRIARSVANLLDEPRLPLLCTPIALMSQGGIVGFDCRVDWARAGLDDDAAVAHVVEDTGMSRALDLALVRTLVAQLAEWERDPPGSIVPGLGACLTIPGSLSMTVVDAVRDELARSSIIPSCLWLGIPEAAVAARPRGRVARCGRARRSRRRRGAARLRIRCVFAGAAAQAADTDDHRGRLARREPAHVSRRRAPRVGRRDREIRACARTSRDGRRRAGPRPRRRPAGAGVRIRVGSGIRTDRSRRERARLSAETLEGHTGHLPCGHGRGGRERCEETSCETGE